MITGLSILKHLKEPNIRPNYFSTKSPRENTPIWHCIPSILNKVFFLNILQLSWPRSITQGNVKKIIKKKNNRQKNRNGKFCCEKIVSGISNCKGGEWTLSVVTSKVFFLFFWNRFLGQVKTRKTNFNFVFPAREVKRETSSVVDIINKVQILNLSFCLCQNCPKITVLLIKNKKSFFQTLEIKPVTKNTYHWEK